jgi:hypothetical protein
MTRASVLVCFLALAACDDGEPLTDGDADLDADSGADGDVDADGDGDADADGDADGESDGDADAETVVCGSGEGELPDGLIELAWDDGTPFTTIGEQSWTITVETGTYELAEEPLYEAVRFELDHPARIHGFAVQWANLPADGDPGAPLEAGLYPDFGYNGFDFFRWSPYWTGSRCLEDVAEGEWVTYLLDEPVEVEQPGLVYVAHLREGEASPSFPFDESYIGAGRCESWDECHTAVNMHEAGTSIYYNGVSIPLPYDYLVRLYVEYTDDLAPEDRVFQPVPDLAMGSRVSWGDYDDDGWEDFVSDGPRLMRNDGAGGFTNETEAAGLTGVSGGGGVWGDYDNDGCLDLFVFSESLTSPDALLRSNCDGTFSNVTDAAGIVDEQDYNQCGDPANIRAPSPAAAWFDLDADGFLDLYVANFICWGEESYYVDTVFLNDGDGTFTEITGTRGFSDERTASRGANPIDIERDGDIDVLVNNYRLQYNFMFVNNGDGAVRDRGRETGLQGEPTSHGGYYYYGHTIGTAWGDLDNDGDFDLIESNLAHPRFFDFSDKTRIMMNDGDGVFTDISGDWDSPVSDAGLRYSETHSVPVLADFDQDGDLDLVITAVYDGRPTDFYWGNGDGTFELDVYHAGITTENGWGTAVADYDHDGDLDLAAASLFENTADAAGHWLQVRVIGNVASNRAAIGAVVEVSAADLRLLRHVQGGTGQGCQDSPYLHFGLGEETSVDEIRVTFPGGATVTFDGPFEADQRLWLFEDGTVHTGWAPPES